MALRKPSRIDKEKCGKCLLAEEFAEKRAMDFKKEPYEFLRGYCDKLNIWEEGALLIRKRLSEIKESRHLTKELKVILEKVERELLKENWMNIPKHPGYDKNLRIFLSALKDTHPHFK